jgi:hypothetical protein
MRTRRWTATVALAASMASAGCWGQPGAGPGNTFANGAESTLTIDNVASLEAAWSGRGGLSAVVSGKTVGAYWTGSGVDVVAHDVATGAEAWSRTLTPAGTDWGYPTHAPVVAGDDVWVGYVGHQPTHSCAFGMARLDLATGSVVATDTTAAPVELVPFDDRVAVITNTFSPSGIGRTCWPDLSDPMRVVDAATGVTEWEPTGFLSSWAAVTVVGDELFAVDASGLHRFPAAGCGAPTCPATWETQPNGVGALYDVAGDATGPLLLTSPNAEGGMDLLAVDKATGDAVGSAPLGVGGQALALAGGTVYVAGGTTLAAYDVASCSTGACARRWTASLGGTATWANALAVAGDVVYVGREDGVVEAFAAAGCGSPTCPAVTSVAVDGTVLQLAVSQGHLFVGADTPAGSGVAGGRVTAFAPASPG